MFSTLSRLAGPITAIMLFSCGMTESPPVEEEPPAAPEVPEEPPTQDADAAALVPSPLEMNKALKDSGIQTELSSLVTARDVSAEPTGNDQAAIRTGIVLADLLLTVDTSDKDVLMGQIGTIKQGMAMLGGGSDIDATLTDIHSRVQTDAVTRDELLKEFDELSGAVIPELEFNGQERVVPLIQAGSWLEGANLVAKALKTAEDTSAAEGLLKAPAVVDHFLKYVEEEGSEKAPEAITATLKTSLGALKEMAGKAEPLAQADLDAVAKVTDEVLALL
ncbi:MAG: hypothetical protein KTR31_36660 [Myxococcales bacterium]|nr:hypothetical protein [Myxococcales bacterium]